MFRKTSPLITGPVFPGEEDTRLARLVHILSLSLAVTVLMPMLVNLLSGNRGMVWTMAACEVGFLVALGLNFARRLKWAIPVLCYTLMAGTTVQLCISDQGVQDVAIVAYAATLIVAAMLLDTPQFTVFSAVTVLNAVGVMVAEQRGILTPRSGFHPAWDHLLQAAVTLGTTGFMAGFLARSMKKSLARSRQKEAELAAVNRELERQADRVKSSEERYRGIIELAVDGILLGDCQGRIIGANTRATELTGYPNEELHGRDISSLYSAEELQRAPLRYDLLKQGQSVITRRTLTRQNGTSVPVEMNSKMMPDGSYQAFLRDITERVRAEEALRRSEERYRLLFNSGIDAAFVNIQLQDHVPGKFLEVNDLACERLGYTREELLKMSPLDIDAPETIPNVPKIMERLAVDKRAVWEGVHLAKGGRRIPVEIRSHVFDLDGKPVILSTAHDLTERKRAAEAVRRSEQNYSEVFNAANDAIFVHDSKTGEILDVNQAMQSMFGYSREEALQLAADQACEGKPPYSANDAMQWIRKAIEQGPQVFEWRSRRKNGQIFWTEIALRSTSIGGHGRVLAIVRDIGERKRAEDEKDRLEQQLRQAQKMEAIGQLAGGIAHDFNNLITVIGGYAELVTHNLPPDHPMMLPLSQVLAASERARDLTRQILAFGRKQTLRTEIINLNAELPATEKMIRRLIGEDIDVQTHLSPELGNVKADPSQIQQVLLNLAVNARDAMPQGGKLAIETADVALDATHPETSADVPPGRYVVLSVSDTGCGMDNDTLSHLFEPFFTTKPLGKGTGLGLATAFGIIRQHGGHIAVSSEPGKGSTFRIYLPRVESERTPAQPQPPAATTPTPTATETVLLVEDESTLREFVFRVLSDKGYRVLTAASPADAQRLAADNATAIDLILTDVILPEMNGPELYERLMPANPRLKVLYMSGYADGLLDRHADGSARTIFLAKPFRIQTLLNKVREAIEHK